MSSFTNIGPTNLSSISDLKQFYVIDTKIGSGSFGIVYKAYHSRTKKLKALKIGTKNHNNKLRFDQEIKILSMINHPNIIQLETVYETPHSVCLVLEYCPTDLSKLYHSRGPLTEKDVQEVMKYLSSALAYLHEKGIAHRDLKLENILLTDNPNDAEDTWFIKITDFGLSACKTNFRDMLNEFCGTLHYMAPELRTKSYSELCDIWSLGIIMFVLLFGRFPYKFENYSNIKETILKTKIDFAALNCSQGAVHLIQKCLQPNPVMRITAAEIEHHPWILGRRESVTDYPNVIEMMNAFNENINNFADTLLFDENESISSYKNTPHLSCSQERVSLQLLDNFSNLIGRTSSNKIVFN